MGILLGPFCDMQHVVSFLVLQTPLLRRDSWLLFIFIIVMDVMSLLLLFLFIMMPWVGFVEGFLDILTYFLKKKYSHNLTLFFLFFLPKL